MNPEYINDTAFSLERIAARATSLYSRPTVALEIIRLTEQPHVDARALRECLERDPALACKILRVVNSSLFGLRVQVGGLGQALALLGIKPLKLLVLGFSLPDGLFAGVAAKQLQWYWTNALTRAVAARLLSEQLWRQPGDEAFTAAMLEDIGILVLMRELGEPYNKFLAGVISEHRSLAALERETLGFDHTQLSAMLLARWRLPAKLVAAVAAPKETTLLAQLASPEADMPQILHLADLLVELVSQRRLTALPELLEAGEAFHALTASKLTELVETLEPQVDQLAKALSLELRGDRNYLEVLAEAHQQMASGLEEFAHAFHPRLPERDADSRLLRRANELSDAMQSFLAGAATNRAADTSLEGIGVEFTQHESPGDHGGLAIAQAADLKTRTLLLRKIAAAAKRCRERRQEVSLLLVEPNVYDVHVDPLAAEAGRQMRHALRLATASLDERDVELIATGDCRMAAILANCERRAAVSVAHHTIARLKSSDDQSSDTACELATTLSAGVATVAGIPKNFDAAQLLESAERCLAAARTCGISTVKSIEV